MKDMTQATTPCTLDDLTYLQDVTEFYGVSADGQPTWLQNTTEDGEFRSYQCDVCDGEFDTWEAALAHVKEVAL